MAILPVVLMFASAAQAAPTTPSAGAAPAPVDPLDKIKCVREDVTGSLVLSRKVCHTVREWRRIATDAQAETQRMAKPGTLNEFNGG